MVESSGNLTLWHGTHLVPKLRHFLWVGTNLAAPAAVAWRRREPDDRPFAGERFSEATEVTVSLTDSFELEELGAGEGGSSFRDSLQPY